MLSCSTGSGPLGCAGWARFRLGVAPCACLGSVLGLSWSSSCGACGARGYVPGQCCISSQNHGLCCFGASRPQHSHLRQRRRHAYVTSWRWVAGIVDLAKGVPYTCGVDKVTCCATTWLTAYLPYGLHDIRALSTTIACLLLLGVGAHVGLSSGRCGQGLLEQYC